jgi:hypothetical protein
MSRSQDIDLAKKMSIAEGFQSRDMADDFTIFCELFLAHLADLARRSALEGRGVALAQAHEEIGHSIRLANALNLDRRQTILDALAVLGSSKSQ